MEVNVNSGPENDRESEHNPTSEGELYSTTWTRREERALIARDQHEKNRYAGRGENMHSTGKRVTLRSLRTPGLRSQPLKSVENAAHPEPTGEDRSNTGDETWNKRVRKVQAVHDADATVTDSARRRQGRNCSRLG